MIALHCKTLLNRRSEYAHSLFSSRSTPPVPAFLTSTCGDRDVLLAYYSLHHAGGEMVVFAPQLSRTSKRQAGRCIARQRKLTSPCLHVSRLSLLYPGMATASFEPRWSTSRPSFVLFRALEVTLHLETVQNSHFRADLNCSNRKTVGFQP